MVGSERDGVTESEGSLDSKAQVGRGWWRTSSARRCSQLPGVEPWKVSGSVARCWRRRVYNEQSCIKIGQKASDKVKHILRHLDSQVGQIRTFSNSTGQRETQQLVCLSSQHRGSITVLADQPDAAKNPCQVQIDKKKLAGEKRKC